MTALAELYKREEQLEYLIQAEFPGGPEYLRLHAKLEDVTEEIRLDESVSDTDVENGPHAGDAEADYYAFQAERPVHRPEALDAPIPGVHWFSACDPDRPRVGASGICSGCGEAACPVCGKSGSHVCDGPA